LDSLRSKINIKGDLYALDRLKRILDDDDSDESYDAQEIVSDTTSFGSIEDEKSNKKNHHDEGLKTIFNLHEMVEFKEGCPPPLAILPYEPNTTCNDDLILSVVLKYAWI
jgi:hypothetical protein